MYKRNGEGNRFSNDNLWLELESDKELPCDAESD